MALRVAELIGGLSLATDMGAGLPPQTVLAATILATRMAARLGLSGADQSLTYYTAALRFIGCTAAAPESVQLGAGEDMSLNYALSMCDLTRPDDVAAALDKHWAKNADAHLRRDIIRTLSQDLSQIGRAAAMHCAQAVVLARRLPVGEHVPRLLGFMYDRHDGVASSHGGDEIPVPARLCSLAAHAAVFLRALGKHAALELVVARRGSQFCPECVDLLARDSDSLLEGLDAPSCWQAFLDAEPGALNMAVGQALDEICAAYGDYADQKSGFLLGHSRHVARLAFLAGDAAGLHLETRQRLRQAALLHDVGRAGVPSGLWNKPGPLNGHERRIVESHDVHTETILRLAPALLDLCDTAAGAHERADRTGYPRATTLSDLHAGILAAADVYEALTHDRPWRVAYSAAEASNQLIAEAKNGRLPRQAVSVVLDAAGHGVRTTLEAYPAGLSRREAEVLSLIAQGLSTKEIAQRLAIAPKTAENHVGHVYEKTGARGRAAAALFAVEHGLNELSLTPVEP